MRLPVIALLTIAFLSGCASVYKPQNKPVTGAITKEDGYRLHRAAHMFDPENKTLLILSFSGGGTRAAALSYGVLKGLRDTPITSNPEQAKRMLDEVDIISSVSGGSFTSAYYGLYGEGIFETYESRFLKQSVQGALIRKLFNPLYWMRSLFSAFDRTEMAIDYYDTYIFKGATFADIPHDRSPFIEINATDLNAGARFSFTQRNFDLICSDLDQFSIARAVTASSAVPLLFPSVVIENYSGQCDNSQTPIVQQLQTTPPGDQPNRLHVFNTLHSYANTKDRPYIHLVDGGISDNLGLRAIMERLATFGYIPGVNDPFERFDHVAFILVNAEVKPQRSIDQSAEKPSIGKTVDAVSAAQIASYTLETRTTLQRGIDTQNEALEAAGQPAKFHFIEISFEDVASRKLKDYLNNLPTSLELGSDQVDELVQSGRVLLLDSPEYQHFVERVNTP